MSWVTKKEKTLLETAIANAFSATYEGQRQTLVFASTADEGTYSGSVYPADYPNVISVSATDHYGHLTPKTAGPKEAHIQIPGEKITAYGPVYIPRGSEGNTATGSSVATALAAGIASLALILLQTFNVDERAMTRAEMNKFYTREGILRVFNKMNSKTMGIQLDKLFPNEVDAKTLHELWNKDNFLV
jgi:hypothetical protein